MCELAGNDDEKPVMERKVTSYIANEDRQTYECVSLEREKKEERKIAERKSNKVGGNCERRKCRLFDFLLL